MTQKGRAGRKNSSCHWLSCFRGGGERRMAGRGERAEGPREKWVGGGGGAERAEG